MNQPRTVLLLGLLFLALAGCGQSVEGTQPQRPAPTDTPIPTNTAIPSPSPTATATATPLPTETPTSTPTPSPPSAARIYELVAPSIPFVETPLGTGSGILVEGNYVVTNAHVIWPYNQARIVFADGSEFEAVPLVNADHLIDLAVLGPLPDVSAPPLRLVDGEGSVIGSDVYLVGYPVEVDAFPEPTMTRGLISRQREWDSAAITYFQTDATIAPGQSGGALISEMGEVIGISGFTFLSDKFGLIASAADLVAPIAQLADHNSDVVLGPPRQFHTVRLRHALDGAIFLLAPGCAPTLEVEAKSDGDIVLQHVDLTTGELQEVDQGLEGAEYLTVSDVAESPQLLIVYAFDGRTPSATIQSSCDLMAFQDRDDETLVYQEETIRGTIDFFGDTDAFFVDMKEGEEINFLLEAVIVDPRITITYAGARSGASVSDDNSGGGLFGLNAELTFRAPHTGRFTVLVDDPSGSRRGGYTLALSSSRSNAPTPPPWSPTPTPIDTPYGPMQTYESERYPFTMQLPFSWEDTTVLDATCTGTCFEDPDTGAVLILTEEDLEALLGEAGKNISRDRYVNLVLENVPTFMPQAVLQSRRSMTTSSGTRVEIARYRVDLGTEVAHFKLLIAFEDGIGFTAAYALPDASYSELEGQVDYSFSTLGVEP